MKVLDFGLAFRRRYPTYRKPDTTGTLAYLAPEIIQGQMPTIASGLYALGVMAYALWAGHLPFDPSVDGALTLGSFMNRVVTEPPAISNLPIPADLQTICGHFYVSGRSS